MLTSCQPLRRLPNDLRNATQLAAAARHLPGYSGQAPPFRGPDGQPGATQPHPSHTPTHPQTPMKAHPAPPRIRSCSPSLACPYPGAARNPIPEAARRIVSFPHPQWTWPPPSARCARCSPTPATWTPCCERRSHSRSWRRPRRRCGRPWRRPQRWRTARAPRRGHRAERGAQDGGHRVERGAQEGGHRAERGAQEGGRRRGRRAGAARRTRRTRTCSARSTASTGSRTFGERGSASRAPLSPWACLPIAKRCPSGKPTAPPRLPASLTSLPPSLPLLPLQVRRAVAVRQRALGAAIRAAGRHRGPVAGVGGGAAGRREVRGVPWHERAGGEKGRGRRGGGGRGRGGEGEEGGKAAGGGSRLLCRLIFCYPVRPPPSPARRAAVRRRARARRRGRGAAALPPLAVRARRHGAAGLPPPAGCG